LYPGDPAAEAAVALLSFGVTPSSAARDHPGVWGAPWKAQQEGGMCCYTEQIRGFALGGIGLE